MIDDSEVIAGLSFLIKHAHPRFKSALTTALMDCSGVRAARKLDDLRACAIEHLELSVCANAALTNMGCKTIRDAETLMLKDPREVMRLGKKHHLTRKTYKEILELLVSLGLISSAVRRSA